jgi:hypothetical protein
MDQIVQQRQTVRDFWNLFKQECIGIKSIDEIYEKYKTWLKLANIVETKRIRSESSSKRETVITVGPLPPINRYIFRNMIRKMGYKNGNVECKNERANCLL